MANLFSKIFIGDVSRHFYKKHKNLLAEIGRLEAEFQKLSDFSLREKSSALKNQVKTPADLDEILAPAFALIREAAKRTLQQRHFDVQLLGGIALHNGSIAEMKLEKEKL